MKSLARPAIALAGAAALGVLAFAGPASAAVAAPPCPASKLTITPATAPVGATITISGTGFSGCKAVGSTKKPSSTLTVTIGYGTGGSGDVLTTTQTKTDGTFSTTAKVPAGAIQFRADSSDPSTGVAYTASAPFVVSAAAPPIAVPAGSGGLATTSGGSTTEFVLLGLVGAAGLVLAGAGARSFNRR